MTSTAERIDAAGWRIVLLASLGGTLEFYDFVIFGVFARDIAQAVFPAGDPIVSLMASFAAFAAGYLARPIGGIVLSHYGDRHGRRTVFLWSVFIMSGATLGMGLVPSYAQWGVAASALMVTLRLIQGFCLGGELPGALTYVVETAPRIAPFVCGVVFACVTMGVALATGVSLSVRTFLDPALVPEYGWRIAFVLGGLGGVLSFVLRRSLEESPEFARMKSFAVRQPFLELLRTNLVHVLVGCAILAGTGCFNGLFFSHLPAYLTTVLQYDPRQAVLAQTVGVIASAIGIARRYDRSGVIAETADRVAVMYAGRIVEIGPVRDVVQRPRHPYTQGLMGAIPTLGARTGRLTQIPGTMPRLTAIPEGCAFHPRCPQVFARCRSERPERVAAGPSEAACWLVGQAATGSPA